MLCLNYSSHSVQMSVYFTIYAFHFKLSGITIQLNIISLEVFLQRDDCKKIKPLYMRVGEKLILKNKGRALDLK